MATQPPSKRLVTEAALATALATKADTTHTHGIGGLATTGTPSGTTFLDGNFNWSTPAGGGGGGGGFSEAQINAMIDAKLNTFKANLTRYSEWNGSSYSPAFEAGWGGYVCYGPSANDPASFGFTLSDGDRWIRSDV